ILESKPLGFLLSAYDQSIFNYEQNDKSIGVYLRFRYMNEQYRRIDLTISRTGIVSPVLGPNCTRSRFSHCRRCLGKKLRDLSSVPPMGSYPITTFCLTPFCSLAAPQSTSAISYLCNSVVKPHHKKAPGTAQNCRKNKKWRLV